MIKTLFINADTENLQCSIYENGLKYSSALRDFSRVVELKFIDTHDGSNIPPYGDYDLILFNYQDNVMKNIPPGQIFRAHENGRKSMAFISDMAYNAPWYIDTHWKTFNIEPYMVFDYLGVPDPSLEEDFDDRVCALPRVCRRFNATDRPVNLDNPVISTYGFPSVFKPIYPMVEYINKEFDKATFRLHMPTCSYQPQEFRDMAAKVLAKSKEVAKNGITVEYSEDWKTKGEIIQWLNESDLNIMIPDPSRPALTRGALPATIDDLVSAQRPIAINESIEMRHLLEYVKPYPDYSLKEIMENGNEQVKLAYEEWSAENFASVFDKFISERI